MTGRLHALVVGALCISFLSAGCGGSSTPTSASETVSGSRILWTSAIGAGGQVSRSFTAAAGTVTVTLNSVAIDTGASIGVGIGVPRADGSSCYLSTSSLLNAGSGGAISIPVEAGTYCVSIYDVGSIGSGEAGFAITIAYP